MTKLAARASTLLLLMTWSGLAPGTAAAFETDQFNLPTAPLNDSGPEISAKVYDDLVAAADAANQHLADHPEDRAFAEDVLAAAVDQRLGAGFPTSKIEHYLEDHYGAMPWSYKPKRKQSLFKAIFFFAFHHISLSRTLNVYGVEMGTDKLGHFFPQGYDYFTRVREVLASGGSEEQGLEVAIRWGRNTERKLFGRMISGVWSNADLAANYAGYKFLRNLRNEVSFGGVTYPPMIEEDAEGRLVVAYDAARKEDLLRPYISRHFNEALNPSNYYGSVHKRARRVIDRFACPQWRAQAETRGYNRQSLESEIQSHQLWHGEDYGFMRDEKRWMTVAERCF